MLAVIGIVNQEGRSIKSKKGARWDRHNTVTDMEQRRQTKKQKQDTKKLTGPALDLDLKFRCRCQFDAMNKMGHEVG